jgi:glycine/D-amino acid oxidase-like deaminating enzyme
MSTVNERRHVIIVGGGFAGLGCSVRLADHEDVMVTLIDRNNHHQFQPLLYQVATSQLAPSDVAHSLRGVFPGQENVDVKLADIAAVDTASKTARSTDGEDGPRTPWYSRPARSPTSSARQARASTRSHSTRWTTPRACARASSASSSRSIAIRRWCGAARSTS